MYKLEYVPHFRHQPQPPAVVRVDQLFSTWHAARDFASAEAGRIRAQVGQEFDYLAIRIRAESEPRN